MHNVSCTTHLVLPCTPIPNYNARHQVGMYYMYRHAETFAEGIAQLRSVGVVGPSMMMIRATTAGSWRLGAAAWDGDAAHHPIAAG